MKNKQTHKSNPNMKPDENYQNGKLNFLVAGNECRLLDRRRTPGVIKSIDLETGFFHWEITDFEDSGKVWEVEFEGVDRYQFLKGCSELATVDIFPIEKRISELNKELKILWSKDSREKTHKNLNGKREHAREWLQNHSKFLKSEELINFEENKGPKALRDDFNLYMDSFDLKKIDIYTTKNQVLNPFSGDWIKAVQVSLAEMGFKNYYGKIIRSEKIFDKVCSRDILKNYIEYRIALFERCSAISDCAKLSYIEE